MCLYIFLVGCRRTQTDKKSIPIPETIRQDTGDAKPEEPKLTVAESLDKPTFNYSDAVKKQAPKKTAGGLYAEILCDEFSFAINYCNT